MLKKIRIDDMRKKMGEILDCVNLRGDEFIIERKQKPVAGLIPIQKLAAIQEISKSFLLEMLEGNICDLNQEEMDSVIEEAKEYARKKRK